MIHHISRTILTMSIAVAAISFAGCSGHSDDGPENFDDSGRGLFICNEGNFTYGYGSLSYYTPENDSVRNEVFMRANGYKLGNTVQSMTIGAGSGWIVVNNSEVIFAIDPNTFKEKGRITGLTSPRYIHFVNDTKAYVTQMYDNRIAIVNPARFEITGYIEIPGMTTETGSTEQMVSDGKYVYCNCWSYQNRILRIDTETDRVVASLEVGIQPNSIVMDRNHKLWTITDGGYEESPYGYETPRLHRIDPATFKIEKEFSFTLGDYITKLHTDGDGSHIYWINGGVWKMDISAATLPAAPLINEGTFYYGMTVDPVNSDIYVSDAIDFSQAGLISRFDDNGRKINDFYVGVAPGAFCWKTTTD